MSPANTLSEQGVCEGPGNTAVLGTPSVVHQALMQGGKDSLFFLRKDAK